MSATGIPGRRAYTASHWGVYEVEAGADGQEPAIRGLRNDPDPSPIGLDQFDPQVRRLRVARPSIRQSWLEGAPGPRPTSAGVSRLSRWDGMPGAIVTDDVMPGVARLSAGSWLDPGDGLERNGNPNSLTLDRGSSSFGQGCVAHTCLVEARRFDGPAPAVRAYRCRRVRTAHCARLGSARPQACWSRRPPDVARREHAGGTGGPAARRRDHCKGLTRNARAAQ